MLYSYLCSKHPEDGVTNIIDICAIVVIREFRSLHMLTAMVNILHI